MVIAFVIDQFDDLTNGTTASARRFVENLRKSGHTVRILTSGKPGQDKYILPQAHIPVVTRLAKKQGVIFSKADKKIITECLTGVDVVHFYLPFPMARTTEKIARKMGVPCIAAFHVQAENITYNIGLGKSAFAARFFYKFLYHYFYKRFADIHCPTQFIADELKTNGYKSHLHVISNGVDELFYPRAPIAHDNIRILMIGRLSPEKRQDVVIDAIKKSKYSDKIELYFAGQGPLLKDYEKMGEDLTHKPTFKFYSTEQLIELIRSVDLYVHASDVEIEAIACMEAFSCGLVPVISNSKKSATVYFALDYYSLFEQGNSTDLAKKIDYWIENPEEKQNLGKKYAKLGNEFRVEQSVRKMEDVYQNLKSEDKWNVELYPSY